MNRSGNNVFGVDRTVLLAAMNLILDPEFLPPVATSKFAGELSGSCHARPDDGCIDSRHPSS